MAHGSQCGRNGLPPRRGEKLMGLFQIQTWRGRLLGTKFNRPFTDKNINTGPRHTRSVSSMTETSHNTYSGHGRSSRMPGP
jgi:hypothetical protein